MSNTPSDSPTDSGTSTGTDTDTNAGTARNRNVLNTDAMQWLSALVALVGLWLVASPFLLESTDAAIWNDTLVGTAIFLLAGYNFYRLTRDRLANVSLASLTVLLGVWIAISPAVIEMGSSELATSTTLSGIVVAALSAYSAYANNNADAPERARTRA
ncbi:SPW repeat protein [Natrialba sp. PRR66]|uniref:SPW repeat domain-containing protein n=1 Tax=Natrialba sp. PRR66 TaxID=3098146 RepID=UPI002B1DB65C|nr:SPW repeat protein [Natrialba sp. PRR66]